MSPLAVLLANTVVSVRLHGDELAAHRRRICLGLAEGGAPCPEHRLEKDGALRCAICGCADPTRTRPRCPAFKW